MTIGEFDDRQSARDGSQASAFPCTLLQERLWQLHVKDGTPGANIAMRWLVNGSLPHAAAEGALRALVQRHEVLRTSFRETDGKLEQLVWPAGSIKLHDIDLSALAGDESKARAEEIARDDAVAPLDPHQAPLLRATLLRLAADRSILLLTFHSLVVDGWSTGLIAREFQAAAAVIDNGGAADTSEPELQFADYALWEKELLASAALDDARAYWRRQLANVVGTFVPPDHPAEGEPSAPRGADQSHITSILLDSTLGQAIDNFARQQNVTLFSLATAALALMLHRVTGDSEIVFGSQVANRAEPEAQDMIGPTVNSVTFRLPIDDNARLRAYVGDVADRVTEALQYQRLPFEIAAGYAPRRNGRPLHAVNLVVHRSYSGTSDTEGAGGSRFTLISLPSYPSGPQWPLNFFMIRRNEGWRISCEADLKLYDPATVQSLVEAWRVCLAALATAPDGTLRDSPALHGLSGRAGAAPRPLPNGGDAGCEPIPVQDPSRQVVRFHESGSKTPLVVLNNRSVYYQLARHLGEERPFIDIMLYHQDGPLALQSYAFEDFADYAVRLIRWAQPHGPYILGGHCVYGVLAFEAARQLRQAGEEVSLVALFDSWAPGYRENMSSWDKMLRNQQLRLDRYTKRLKAFRKGEVGFDEIVRKPILYHLGLLGREAGPEPQALPGNWFDGYLYDTVTRYRPSPYDGNVVLFRSNEPLRGRLFDERMGWGPLVSGRLEKVDVNGGHFDMFRERPAGEIAAFLRTW